MNPLAQIIHRRQMLAPALVNPAHQYAAFIVMENFGFRQQGDFLRIILLDVRQQFFGNVFIFQTVIFAQPACNIHMHVKFFRQHACQRRHVPLLFHAVGRNILGNQIADDHLAHFFHHAAHIVRLQHFIAPMVQHFALVVGHIVVFQHLFAHVEVTPFHFALCIFNLTCQDARLNRHATFRCQFIQDSSRTVKRKQTQQWVLKRQVEAAGTWVALTAGTTAQLIVDTAAFVALRTDNVQATRFQNTPIVFLPALLQRMNFGLFLRVGQLFVRTNGFGLVLHVAAQHDIRTTACHIGGNGNHARFTSLRHNQGFALVFFGVQHIVRQPCLIQQARYQFRVFNGGGADQYRLSALVARFNVFNHRFEFLFGRAENLVVEIFAANRFVGGDNHGFQTINALELVSFRIRRTRHARQFSV